MKKRIIIISGFSGVGKGSVIHRLMDIEKTVFIDQSKVWLSISDTTRAIRNKDGTYSFISMSEFQSRVNDNGYYLEYNFYDGNGYGTPRKPVLDVLE